MKRKHTTRHIIKGLRTQQSKAQRLFFETYSGYLFRICLRYLGQKEKAEDVLSLVFLKIFDKIALTDIQEEAPLKAWIKKIAINECLQEIRKKALFTSNLETLELEQNSDIKTDESLLQEDVLQMIYQLPLGYRTVFSLYVIEGYSHKEIAEQLQISEGTSKSQLSKARKILKEQIIKNEILA